MMRFEDLMHDSKCLLLHCQLLIQHRLGKRFVPEKFKNMCTVFNNLNPLYYLQ